MASQTYLQRRGARYWARIRLPIDIIGFFDRKREFVRSLGTSEPRVAKARLAHVCAKANRVFARIDPMIPEELRRKIARDFYETALRKDELSRLASRSSSEEAEHLELARALQRPVS